jgi:hypothetical protein
MTKSLEVSEKRGMLGHSFTYCLMLYSRLSS